MHALEALTACARGAHQELAASCKRSSDYVGLQSRTGFKAKFGPRQASHRCPLTSANLHSPAGKVAYCQGRQYCQPGRQASPLAVRAPGSWHSSIWQELFTLSTLLAGLPELLQQFWQRSTQTRRRFAVLQFIVLSRGIFLTPRCILQHAITFCSPAGRRAYCTQVLYRPLIMTCKRARDYVLDAARLCGHLDAARLGCAAARAQGQLRRCSRSRCQEKVSGLCCMQFRQEEITRLIRLRSCGPSALPRKAKDRQAEAACKCLSTVGRLRHPKPRT